MADLTNIAALKKNHISAMNKKGIFTENDLCLFFPRTYHDYRFTKKLREAKENMHYAFEATLLSAEKRTMKTGKPYLVIKAVQGGERINVMFFSDVYRLGYFQALKNREVVILGRASYDPLYGFSITNPENIVLKEEFKPRIQPVYGKIKGVPEHVFKNALKEALENAKEPLDEKTVKEYNLMPYPDALSQLHTPTDVKLMNAARGRIIFNDLFYLSSVLKAGKSGIKESTFVLKDKKMLKKFLANLPFSLTADQQGAVIGMAEKARSGERVNALIQGDVGCGKTVVAAAMMAVAAGSGYQACICAPREVLAAQHFAEIKKYGDALGLKTVFLRAGMKAGEKKEALEAIESGEAAFIVGTHSCFSESVKYKNLALVVADEEHLFGIRQKEALEKKAKEGVHMLSMSATPIPRSLVSVLYGDEKEVVLIKEKPAGRLPVKNCRISEHKKAFPFILNELNSGNKCYVVCPAIEDNEETEITSIEAVEKDYRAWFEPRGIKVGVLHGRMKAEETEKEIEKFSNGETQLLISTTVIEVGVDIPDATVMVVEQAERFGMASLHQLRGRVGRGSVQSYCIFICADETNERVSVLASTNDGFEIAEADLKLRGGGDIVGPKQAGNNRYIDEMIYFPEEFKAASECCKKSSPEEIEKMAELYAKTDI